MPLGANVGTDAKAVVSMSKRWGGDGGWARLLRVGASFVDVAIDEDVNCDSERMHTNEEVSVVAFSTAFIS